MNETTRIRDKDGKHIAKLVDNRITDQNNKPLGRYNEDLNYTFDKDGKPVGYGDLRMTLIK